MTRRVATDSALKETLTNKSFVSNAILATVTVVFMALAVVLCVAKDLSNSRVFPSSVYVGEYDVSGKTFLEAEILLEQATGEIIRDGMITFYVDDDAYSYVLSECGIFVDVTDALESALSLGNSESGANGVMVGVGYETNEHVLEKLIRSIAAEIDCEPISATAVLNRETRAFSYVSETYGKTVDVEACIAELKERFANGDFSEYNLIINEIAPEFTVSELRDNTTFVAGFASAVTDNYDRNINISLMCDYVDGQSILPNEVFSINELVGQRTEAKGFHSAPAIMDGKRLENDLGGGICQLSGTLYNAALLANMDIVERWPHSWPSDYVPIGLDSTLDWNSQKDLKLRNMTEYPMYITAWLENSDMTAKNVLHIEIYGEPMAEGITVKVVSEILETIEPTSPKRTYTSLLRAGKTQTVIKARTGYKTRVIRSFYLDGELIDSEIVGTSYYAPIQGEILVGSSSGGHSDGGNNPEPTPGATQTGEPTVPPETPPPEGTPVPSEETPEPTEPNEPTEPPEPTDTVAPEG